MNAIVEDEEWRVVVENDNYEVSSLGQVRRVAPYRSTTVGKILRQSPDLDGYPLVSLYRNSRPRTRRVAILVCEAFHGPRPSAGHEAAHGDGNRRNSRADNLRWATPKENFADRVAHGTDPVGLRNPNAKLTDEEVWAIRSRYFLGETKASLSRCFAVSDTQVHHIVLGKSRATTGAFNPIALIQSIAQVQNERHRQG